MGLKINNENSYALSDDVSGFFTLPSNVALEEENYDTIRNQIYSMDLDVEEKANILNKISTYNTTNSIKEKNKLKKEIDNFIDYYEL